MRVADLERLLAENRDAVDDLVAAAEAVSAAAWDVHPDPHTWTPAQQVPPDHSAECEQVLRDLRARVRQAETVARDAAGKPPRPTMHPYFGPLSLRQSLVICAVHTRHHAASLRKLYPRD